VRRVAERLGVVGGGQAGFDLCPEIGALGGSVASLPELLPVLNVAGIEELEPVHLIEAQGFVGERRESVTGRTGTGIAGCIFGQTARLVVEDFPRSVVRDVAVAIQHHSERALASRRSVCAGENVSPLLARDAGLFLICVRAPVGAYGDDIHHDRLRRLDGCGSSWRQGGQRATRQKAGAKGA